MRTGSSVRSVGSFFLAVASAVPPEAASSPPSLSLSSSPLSHVGEHGHRVLDLLRGDFLGGQDRIQLVHGDIATLLGGLDHLLDGIIGKIEKWAVGCAFAFVFDFLVLFDLCRHLFRRFPEHQFPSG
jgi:hypothetical protein